MNHRQRGNFFDTPKKTTNWMLWLNVIILLYWLILTIAVSIFVVKNWYYVTSFTFFTHFNGNNVVFLFWILLLLMPLVGTFKGFGIELEFFNKNKIAKALSEEKERINENAKKSDVGAKTNEKTIEEIKMEKDTDLSKIREEGGKNNV